jgi:fatty acid desaturase
MAATTGDIATYDASVRAAAYRKHKALVPGHVLRELQRKDSFKGCKQLVLHAATIAVFAAAQRYAKFHCVAGDDVCNLARWSFVILQSFCMAFLFTAFHELTHLTVFSARWPNVVLGNVVGFLIIRPFQHYTFYHYNHHKFTGDPSMDPELQDSFIDLKLSNVFAYIAYLSSVPFWIDRISTLFRHCVMCVLPREEKFLTFETKQRVITEANAYVLLYLLIGFISWQHPEAVGAHVWQLWILPTLLAQPFLRFYLIAEHHGCPNGDSILSNTRTTTTFWWYRWLAWQMPFHTEHHAFPFVPFHQLENLHSFVAKAVEERRSEGCNPSGTNGYIGVHYGLIKKFF